MVITREGYEIHQTNINVDDVTYKLILKRYLTYIKIIVFNTVTKDLYTTKFYIEYFNNKIKQCKMDLQKIYYSIVKSLHIYNNIDINYYYEAMELVNTSMFFMHILIYMNNDITVEIPLYIDKITDNNVYIHHTHKFFHEQLSIA